MEVPGRQPYDATVRQRFSPWEMGNIQPGSVCLGVQVDSTNPQNVRIGVGAEQLRGIAPLTSDQLSELHTRVVQQWKQSHGLGQLASAARRHVLDPAIYREAASRLDRHFTISIVDCGSTLDSAVTQEALRDLDALIVVSSPWVDGASAAGQILEWLANRGLTDLLQRTVVVLNDSDGHADKRSPAPSWRNNSPTTAWWLSRCPSIRTCARAG